MNKIILSVAAALSLAACSTNSDGSINWADNPINHLAGKLMTDYRLRTVRPRPSNKLNNVRQNCLTKIPVWEVALVVMAWHRAFMNPANLIKI